VNAEEIKEITCIICTIGCRMKTQRVEGGLEIEGNGCPRGIEYAKEEMFDPRRTITSSIFVVEGEWPLVSVKTTRPVPKRDICKVMSALKAARVSAPVKRGEILIKNVAGTGVDIVATKSVRKASDN
jgi:CxxC motif-containing protein